MPEQFAFQQIFSDGGAIDCHEWSLPAAAASVDGARHQFLAATGLAEDQNRGIAWRNARERLIDLLHRRTVADHVESAAQVALQAPLLTFELVDAARALQRLSRHGGRRRRELQRFFGEGRGVTQGIQVQHPDHPVALHHGRRDQRSDAGAQDTFRGWLAIGSEVAQQSRSIAPHLLDHRSAHGHRRRPVTATPAVSDAHLAALRVNRQDRSAFGRNPVQNEVEQIALKPFQALPFPDGRCHFQQHSEMIPDIPWGGLAFKPRFRIADVQRRSQWPLRGIHQHFVWTLRQFVQIEQDGTADLYVVAALQPVFAHPHAVNPLR